MAKIIIRGARLINVGDKAIITYHTPVGVFEMRVDPRDERTYVPKYEIPMTHEEAQELTPLLYKRVKLSILVEEDISEPEEDVHIKE